MPELTAAADKSYLEDSDHSQCQSMLQLLDRVGDKWTILLVGTLADGPVSYNAIMRDIGGVSHRMLISTLRGLERDGIVERRALATAPSDVEYELSPLGRSLIGPLEGVMKWIRKNQQIIESARGAFDAQASPN